MQWNSKKRFHSSCPSRAEITWLALIYSKETLNTALSSLTRISLSLLRSSLNTDIVNQLSLLENKAIVRQLKEGGEDSSAVKSIGSSARGLGFCSQNSLADHKRPHLQCQVIWRLLPVFVGTVHTWCADPHSGSHTHKMSWIYWRLYFTK